MSDYLLNCWYVAAWSEDVSGKPLARRLLDTPVVLYRRLDGRVVALHDRCPHRFVPLSIGKIDGDQIVCGYHGLRVDSDGSCVDTRLTGKACEAARVRNFPVEDRDGIIWIWMGDPRRADTSSIADFSFMTDPAHQMIRGTTHVNAHYFLEVDNLLDLSHLDYVHLGSIANGGLTTGKYSCHQEGDTVYSRWDSPDVPVPPQFAPHLPGVDRVDQWTDFRWNAPATLFLYNGVTRVGQAREAGIEVWQGHFVTPETEKSSHYFWGVAQAKELLPPPMIGPIREMIRGVFEGEDLPVIEAQQVNMKGVDIWKEHPVYFPEDAGAVRARKILERMIREEAKK